MKHLRLRAKHAEDAAKDERNARAAARWKRTQGKLKTVSSWKQVSSGGKSKIKILRAAVKDGKVVKTPSPRRSRRPSTIATDWGAHVCARTGKTFYHSPSKRRTTWLKPEGYDDQAAAAAAVAAASDAAVTAEDVALVIQ